MDPGAPQCLYPSWFGDRRDHFDPLFSCFFDVFFDHFFFCLFCSVWVSLGWISPPSDTQNVWFYLRKTYVFDKSHFSKNTANMSSSVSFSSSRGLIFGHFWWPKRMARFGPSDLFNYFFYVFLRFFLEHVFVPVLVASWTTCCPPWD